LAVAEPTNKPIAASAQPTAREEAREEVPVIGGGIASTGVRNSNVKIRNVAIEG
jgi:hypothetical protein